MASTIVTKNSSTASAVPVTGDLTQGELAVNVTDKKLYTKDSGGTVVKLVGGLGNQEANAVAITGGSINGTTVGATTASTGAFTTLSASSTVSGTGFSTYLASPPAIGGTAAAAGSFTTLSASSTTTLSGGTANGVAYLNGSKVVTTGSALTFDGTTFKVQNNNTVTPVFQIQSYAAVGTAIANITYDQGTDIYKLSNPSTYAGSGIDFGTGASSTTRYHIDTSGVHIWTVASEQMRLTSTGLGIGTSSPTFAAGGGLQIKNSTFASCRISHSSYTGLDVSQASDGKGYLWNRDNADILFGTNNTERARIDSSGNLLLGTASVNGLGGTTLAPGYALWNSSNNNTTRLFFQYNSTTIGTVTTTATATAYNTSSDYRLKESIAPMTGALAKVAALKPVTYKWKADGSDGEGFIAHELAEVVPQCVTGEKDAVDEEGKPVYQGIDTSFLVATLTAAIQELKAEFDAYKATHP